MAMFCMKTVCAWWLWFCTDAAGINSYLKNQENYNCLVNVEVQCV